MAIEVIILFAIILHSNYGGNRRDFEIRGIKYQEADDLIPKCDLLSLHFAQVKDTENFLNEERIQKIKKGAVVINTAPMELVDINALEKRLKKQRHDFYFRSFWRNVRREYKKTFKV